MHYFSCFQITCQHSVLRFVLLFAALTLSACASSDKQYPEVYLDSATPMLDVQNALELAKQGDKLLALVLGAQWCHDSRGLAKNFAKHELASILDERYEVVYLDVGYYKDLRSVTQRFGQAHYYATPTVMIIDPHSEKNINWQDHEIWGSADSVPFTEYLDYFDKYSKADLIKTQYLNEDVSQQHLQQIQAFENTQSDRLQYAYSILVPDMINEELGGHVNEKFYQNWNEVRAFRSQLNVDIRQLYLDAKGNPSAELTIPSYPPFTWES